MSLGDETYNRTVKVTITVEHEGRTTVITRSDTARSPRTQPFVLPVLFAAFKLACAEHLDEFHAIRAAVKVLGDVLSGIDPKDWQP